MEKEKLRNKYHGEEAERYDDRRESTVLWREQQAAVEKYLARFPAATRVLDIPVGTGRFLEAYDRQQFRVTGVDASASMLERARTRSSAAELREGNAFQLEFADGSFDVVVCVRFFNWLQPPDFARAFTEIARVAGDTIIANVKTYVPRSQLDFGKMIRQLKFRLMSKVRPPDLVCHDRQQFLDLLAANRLEVVEYTDTTPVYEKRRGLENSVYLIKKKPTR